MEYFIQFLSGLIQDPDTARWITIALIAAAIFIAGLALLFLIVGLFDPIRRRLYDVVGYKPVPRLSGERISQTLRPISPYILPKQDGERSKASERLFHAGYRSPHHLTLYYAIKTLLLIALPVSIFLMAQWFPQFSTKQMGLFALTAGFIGMIAPSYILDRKIIRRKRHLTNGFPDALDLLVVCTEAGLGLNAALQRVARELAASHPVLAEEMALVNAEIRAGVERVEALRNLAKRTGLEDIKGLVALLSQSLRYGTSVAETLRIYSEEFRDKRMQRAEEAAAKLGTKMIFPLVTCMFPGFFIVAVGPAVLKIIAAFSGIHH